MPASLNVEVERESDRYPRLNGERKGLAGTLPEEARRLSNDPYRWKVARGALHQSKRVYPSDGWCTTIFQRNRSAHHIDDLLGVRAYSISLGMKNCFTPAVGSTRTTLGP